MPWSDLLSAAGLAGEHLALAVDEHVLLQVGVGGERLLADGTDEGLHLLMNLNKRARPFLGHHVFFPNEDIPNVGIPNPEFPDFGN